MSQKILAALAFAAVLALGCGDETYTTNPAKPAGTTPATASTTATATPDDGGGLALGGGTSAETDYNARTETLSRPESLYVPPPVATPPPLLESRPISLAEGSGKVMGYYAAQSEHPASMGLIALPGREGLNAAAQHEADILAKQHGFAVFVVDYYAGNTPKNMAAAAQQIQQYGPAKVLPLITAAQAWLKEKQPNLKHTAVLGWADGGTLALAATGLPTPPNAIITYYGDLPADAPAVAQQLGEKHIGIVGLFAREDGWVTPARVGAFEQALNAAAVDHVFETYPTQPGFVFDPDPSESGYTRQAREKLADTLHRWFPN